MAQRVPDDHVHYVLGFLLKERLKDICSAYELGVSGVKAELVERIAEAGVLEWVRSHCPFSVKRCCRTISKFPNSRTCSRIVANNVQAKKRS